jgi:hypothetical protein
VSEVEVDNTGGDNGTYNVEVTFYDAERRVVGYGTEPVYVTAGETATAKVTMDDPSMDDGKLTCEVSDVSSA